MGMPRRYYEYPERFQALNVASTAGASLLAFGFVIIVIYLALALGYGPRRRRQPVARRGYEWMTAVAAPDPQLRRARSPRTPRSRTTSTRSPTKAEVPDAV